MEKELLTIAYMSGFNDGKRSVLYDDVLAGVLDQWRIDYGIDKNDDMYLDLLEKLCKHFS